MRTLLIPALAFALLAGCGESVAENRPPLDRIFSPTGLAVAPRPGGGGDLLYVVNSNYALDYAPDDGGSVIVIDPEASVEPPGGGVAPAAVVGGFRIPSYGGEIAIAHPGLPGCESLPGTTAIVPVRYTNETWVLDVDSNGGLSCASGGCRFPSQDDALDPFGATVVCRESAGGARASAFVTHLSGESTDVAPAGNGFVTEIDLLARTAAAP
ncbi:MAG TPA: hypothetical protein VD838_16720, partial [Anaeromyxobacteraceae bacterium]|nr:hypothetical protein [Anaeromyxobacteraceae bacterium]